MPTKFKKDGVEFVGRGRGVRGTPVTKKYFIKNTPKQELIDYLNANNAKPKIKQKCLNELTGRGINIVWKRPNSEAV